MVRARQPRTRGRVSSTCRTYGLFVRNTRGNSRSKLHHRPFLEDTNLVGDIHSLVLARKTHERLLEAESRDDGVDVLALDVVELVDGVADLSLVGTEIHEEGEDVLRLRYEYRNSFSHLNLLHRRLGDHGLLDDGVNVHLVVLGDGSSLILGLAGKLQSVRAEEVSVRVNLRNSLLLFTLNLLSSSSSYDDETIAKSDSYPE